MGTTNHLSKHNGVEHNGSNRNIYELQILELSDEEDEEKDTNGDLVALAEKNEKDEDDLWHEERLSRKLVLRKKINEYVNSFTVHGLTKIFTGTKIESIFWATMLFGGILLSILIVHGLVSKFYAFGIYTEIRSQITEQNFFPSVTFCENQLLIDTYFSYCGVPPRTKHKNHTISCHDRSHMTPHNISTRNHMWSNGLFNVTKCESWGGKHCSNSKYFKSLKHFNHSCVTWNFDGNLHDIYSHVDIEFEFNAPATLDKIPVIIAIPHDPEIHEIDITNKVDIEPLKHYEIKLDKTVVKRLPSPYPSNCSHEKAGDIFPGKYTRRSCIESHNYIEMYKKCGDTLDYIRQFIPKDILHAYKKNLTIREAEVCIWLFGQAEAQKTKNCAFPCDDLDLGIISTFHERNIHLRGNKTTYHVSIQYQRVDTFKVMEEKELYKWDQMACEIGGLIGLVIGASVISLVEIFAYIFLVIVNRLI